MKTNHDEFYLISGYRIVVTGSEKNMSHCCGAV